MKASSDIEKRITLRLELESASEVDLMRLLLQYAREHLKRREIPSVKNEADRMRVMISEIEDELI